MHFISSLTVCFLIYSQFFRFFITQTAWVLPTLNDVLKTLRDLAAQVRLTPPLIMYSSLTLTLLHLISFQADSWMRLRGAKTDALEDAARICNKAFTNCLTDRYAPFFSSPNIIYISLPSLFLSSTGYLIYNPKLTLMVSHRSPLIVNGRKNSRKWGTYAAVGITLKSYIKVELPLSFTNSS